LKLITRKLQQQCVNKTIFASISQVYKNIEKLDTEKCFHVELEAGAALSADDERKLKWILNSQAKDSLGSTTTLVASGKSQTLIEVGPRFNFSTADSTNSVSICQSAQLVAVKRIEVSVRYLVKFSGDFKISTQDEVRKLIN
jgi:phosphoribosylformylglycinamidine synthase